MKCPECGFIGVLDNEKFCGECGANIRTDKSKWDEPNWKWGSLIASNVLVFIFWFLAINYSSTYHGQYHDYFQLGLAIFGFPTIIYLMYKERVYKIKYGIAWISFPLITWFSGAPNPYQEIIITYFIIFVIPAIIIDIWYIRKLTEVGK